MRHLLVGVMVVASLLTADVSQTQAAAGDLDPEFGDGGIASIDLGPGSDRGWALARQDDGKIVVTGQGPVDDNLSVVRFNENGTVDGTFSTDGVFTTDRVDRGTDVLLTEDGKIVAAGDGDDHLIRLNPNGTLDGSFGEGDGVTGSQFFNPEDPDETYPPEMNRLVPWDDGGVIVAGTIDYGPYFFTFARYRTDGFIDIAFGDDGQVQDDFSPADDGLDQEPLALARYGADRFVAAGYRDIAEDISQESSVIAVYNEDGTRDESFGDDGKTTSNIVPDEGEFFGDEAIREVFPMSDGRILAIGDGEMQIGDTFGVKYVPFFAMYDTDGTFNSEFGNDGTILFEMGDDSRTISAAGVAPDGKIVIAGDDETEASDTPYVARFTPDGQPDPEFGVGGWALIDLGTARADFADLAIDESGDIYIAGSYQNGDRRTAVFKFKGSASTPRTFGDINCNGNADSVDALGIQRDLAALPVNQTQPCPEIGETVDIQGASEHPWGDIDCDEDVDTVDSLKILRFVAALPVQQETGCPVLGSAVEVAEAGRH